MQKTIFKENKYESLLLQNFVGNNIICFSIDAIDVWETVYFIKTYISCVRMKKITKE